jgi:hypothetical protein
MGGVSSGAIRCGTFPPGAKYTLSQRILELVWMERLMQRDALIKGRAAFDCASLVVSDDRKLRALMSVVGDVAKRIDENERVILKGSNKQARANNLRHDVVRIAGTAFAWLEALEGELK